MYRSKKKKTKMNKSRRKNNKGGAGCRDCPQNLRDDIDKFLHLVKNAHSGASKESKEKANDCYDYLVKKVQSIPCEIRKNLKNDLSDSNSSSLSSLNTLLSSVQPDIKNSRFPRISKPTKIDLERSKQAAKKITEDQGKRHSIVLAEGQGFNRTADDYINEETEKDLKHYLSPKSSPVKSLTKSQKIKLVKDFDELVKSSPRKNSTPKGGKMPKKKNKI